MPRPPALLPGVDRSAFATSLGRRLHEAGVDIGLTAVETFTRALAVTELDRRSRLYWAARVTLVRRPVDLPVFDEVFEAVFGAARLAVGPHARPPSWRSGLTPRPEGEGSEPDATAASVARAGDAGLPWLRRAAMVGADQSDESADPALPDRLPSGLEAIADRPFADLDPADLVRLESWLAQALAHWPTRASRRYDDHRSGRRISLRRTLRQARRTGFEPIRLQRERPRRRPRRLVMVCDVSQSMQPYAAAYLHLMRAAALVTRSEVFAFATSLTRLTAVLAQGSPEAAIERAETLVTDRFGGTRIASNLRRLLASHHGESVRGAVVIIASDGWDGDGPNDLAAVMARLHRRAHRVIWVNPRAAAPGYAPLVGSMAAALPYCDLLLPAHTVRDLAAVLDAITGVTAPDRAVSSRA